MIFKIIIIGWALTTLLLVKWVVQYFYEEYKKIKPPRNNQGGY